MAGVCAQRRPARMCGTGSASMNETVAIDTQPRPGKQRRADTPSPQGYFSHIDESAVKVIITGKSDDGARGNTSLSIARVLGYPMGVDDNNYGLAPLESMMIDSSYDATTGATSPGDVQDHDSDIRNYAQTSVRTKF